MEISMVREWLANWAPGIQVAVAAVIAFSSIFVYMYAGHFAQAKQNERLAQCEWSPALEIELLRDSSPKGGRNMGFSRSDPGCR